MGNSEDLLNAVARMKAAEGWGTFMFDLTFKDGQERVIVKDSFEAKGYGRSHAPTCHFVRGYLAGALSTALNREVCLTEIRCLAKGDEHCEFQIQEGS